MTAPSAAFMAAGLWRPGDQGHVRVSIRAAGKEAFLAYRQQLFTPLTPPWCCMHSPCAAILKEENARGLQFGVYNKIREGPLRRKEAAGTMCEREEMSGGGRTGSRGKVREAEGERQR